MFHINDSENIFFMVKENGNLKIFSEKDIEKVEKASRLRGTTVGKKQEEEEELEEEFYEEEEIEEEDELLGNIGKVELVIKPVLIFQRRDKIFMQEESKLIYNIDCLDCKTKDPLKKA